MRGDLKQALNIILIVERKYLYISALQKIASGYRRKAILRHRNREMKLSFAPFMQPLVSAALPHVRCNRFNRLKR